MIFQEELEAISKAVPGCMEAVLMNLDGLVLQKHVQKQNELDAEILLVELTNALKGSRQAVEIIQGGGAKEFSLVFEKGIVLLRFLSDEYYAALLLEPGGLIGKARYLLRVHSHKLASELS